MSGVVLLNFFFFSSFIRSENYLVRWGSNGMPKEIEKLNNLQAVFTVSCCIYILEILSRCKRLRFGFFPSPLPSREDSRGHFHEHLRSGECFLKVFFLICQSKAVLKAYYSAIPPSVGVANPCISENPVGRFSVGAELYQKSRLEISYSLFVALLILLLFFASGC